MTATSKVNGKQTKYDEKEGKWKPKEELPERTVPPGEAIMKEEPISPQEEIKRKEQEIEDLRKKAMAEEEALEEVEIVEHLHCEVCNHPFFVSEARKKGIARCYKCR